MCAKSSFSLVPDRLQPLLLNDVDLLVESASLRDWVWERRGEEVKSTPVFCVTPLEGSLGLQLGRQSLLHPASPGLFIFPQAAACSLPQFAFFPWTIPISLLKARV